MGLLKKLFGNRSAVPTHRVTDDSGFLTIVDPDAYQSFVQPDWTLGLLRSHFVKEMAARHMLIWGTGLEKFWDIKVALEPTGISGFRELVGSIQSSKGRLLLTNYESLTIAAAYNNVSLPQHHEMDQILSVQPGLFDCRIVQLSDPKTEAPFKERVNFVYEISKAIRGRAAWDTIPWNSSH